MKSRRAMLTVLLTLLGILAALALAIALGGPSRPPAMDSINNPFNFVDYSRLPKLATFRGPDGENLAFREYTPGTSHPSGSVVLIHGSSASSNSMHPMALALSEAGLKVYALDIRGHGASGTKGRVVSSTFHLSWSRRPLMP